MGKVLSHHCFLLVIHNIQAIVLSIQSYVLLLEEVASDLISVYTLTTATNFTHSNTELKNAA